jgi:hypothetical protein
MLTLSGLPLVMMKAKYDYGKGRCDATWLLSLELKLSFFASAAPSCNQQRPCIPLQWINGDINAHYRLLCHFIMETGSWDQFLSESLDKATF